MKPTTVDLCRCGVPRADKYFWHKTGNHDCDHHRVDRCPTCAMFRGVEQMLIEAAACE